MANRNHGIDMQDLPMPRDNRQRDHLLGAYRNTMRLLDWARQDIVVTGSGGVDDMAVCRQQLADCATNLREAYRAGVPFVGLSRCPISGEVLRHSLDIHGLDGLWWNSGNPIRPREERSKTLFAFTGAMTLNKEVEFTDFLVKPGPGVPFVIPKLLLLDEHTAALDPKTAELVMGLTNTIVKENRLTTLMVTHNMNQAIRYGNVMIMLHEGKIKFYEEGRAKQLLTVEDIVRRFGSDLKDETLLCR